MSDTINIIFRVPSGGNLVVATPIGESLMSVAIRPFPSSRRLPISNPPLEIILEEGAPPC